MKLDPLRAGIKTALVTFLSTLAVLLVGILDELSAWATAGTPPDIGYIKGTVMAAALAFAAGVLNTLARFAQTAGTPFISGLVDKVLGAPPIYTPPPEGPADLPGADDMGQSPIYLIVAVLAAVALVIWISRAL